MNIRDNKEYEAASKASRKLMYQMRKRFTGEQFDKLSEIVEAQERFRLQFGDNVTTYPFERIYNAKTGRVMKREDALPDPEPEPVYVPTAAEIARRDCKVGKIRKAYDDYVHAACRGKTDAECAVAEAWLAEYWAAVKSLRYAPYLHITNRGRIRRLGRVCESCRLTPLHRDPHSSDSIPVADPSR